LVLGLLAIVQWVRIEGYSYFRKCAGQYCTRFGGVTNSPLSLCCWKTPIVDLLRPGRSGRQRQSFAEHVTRRHNRSCS
jgi:hypothetical protein